MDQTKRKIRKELILFFILIAFAALGNGLSDSVYSNYFKEVYHISATQRAFIEFPRELPGLLCAVIIAAFSFLGDFRLTVIAQILAFAGLIVLGLYTPSFAVMLIFLFTNSLGMHLFMPLGDSVGMSLAEPDKVGMRVGQYGSIRTAVGFFAGIFVFVGFRVGFFSFRTQIKYIFIAGAAAFVIAAATAAILLGVMKSPRTEKKPFRLLFRREYKYYYLLTVLNGVQKQIAYVFGSWVIVDLLLKGADVMSVLLIASSFLGIFFMSFIGRLIDRFGIKTMMYVDALSFIIVYIIYGLVVWGITSKLIPSAGISVIVVYCLFVLDRLSMQTGIVKAVYLRSIALKPSDITPTLSTGTSLDHVVSIVAAQISGLIWTYVGPQWVFFMAAFFSLGNLFVAWNMKEQKIRRMC